MVTDTPSDSVRIPALRRFAGSFQRFSECAVVSVWFNLLDLDNDTLSSKVEFIVRLLVTFELWKTFESNALTGT